MAKRRMEKHDKTGWSLFNRLLGAYVEWTRFPDLPEHPRIGKNYEYFPEGAVCGCGKPYHGCIRLGTENKLIIGFSGGGVSFSEYTAARPQRIGNQEQNFYADDVWFGDVVPRMGTFGQNKKNPFRDWSLLFVPYASGDFHCGTADYPYTDLNGQKAVLYHHGYTNYRALLKKIKEFVPNPDQILVTGFSAGAFATSLLTDDICEAFPQCKNITACVDSAIMCHPDWHQVAKEVWKSPPEIADRLAGPEIVTDSLLALHEKRPDVKIMYCCSKRDAALTQFVGFLEENGNWNPTKKTGDMFQAHLKDMVQRLKSAIPNISIFIFDTPDKNNKDAELTVHCLCGSNAAFQTAVDGVTCVDWMRRGVGGEVIQVGLEKLK